MCVLFQLSLNEVFLVTKSQNDYIDAQNKTFLWNHHVHAWIVKCMLSWDKTWQHLTHPYQYGIMHEGSLSSIIILTYTTWITYYACRNINIISPRVFELLGESCIYFSVATQCYSYMHWLCMYKIISTTPTITTNIRLYIHNQTRRPDNRESNSIYRVCELTQSIAPIISSIHPTCSYMLTARVNVW